MFVPLNELCIVQQHPTLGSLKRARTITQSKVQPGVQTRTKGQNHSPKTETSKKRQTKNQHPKNQNHKQKTQSYPAAMDVLCQKKGNLCADEFKKDLAESNHSTNQTSQQDRGEGAKTNHRSAVPKPRIPLTGWTSASKSCSEQVSSN